MLWTACRCKPSYSFIFRNHHARRGTMFIISVPACFHFDHLKISLIGKETSTSRGRNHANCATGGTCTTLVFASRRLRLGEMDTIAGYGYISFHRVTKRILEARHFDRTLLRLSCSAAPPRIVGCLARSFKNSSRPACLSAHALIVWRTLLRAESHVGDGYL